MFAIAYFGRPVDTGPPTAPTNPADLRPGRGGYLSVRWDASQDDVFVAGYEVVLNGVLVSTVGGTSSYVPYTGVGTYIVRVRAFDSSGAYSPEVWVGLVIDPPPPSTPPTSPAPSQARR